MTDRNQRREQKRNEKAAKKEEKADRKEWRTGKPRKNDPLKPFKDGDNK